MTRDNVVSRICGEDRPWDVLVIGGGASGFGAALEAASRGHHTLLLEGVDFGQGTSSRSTKLIHGGLRYLRQGQIGLVRESLRERGLLLKNAPHLVRPLGFVIPCFRWGEKSYYRFGLSLYDRLSGQYRIGHTRGLSKTQTLEQLTGINPENLSGGVHYEDGQFDDARLIISLFRTLLNQGGQAINHARVTRLVQENDRVCGVIAQDQINHQEWEIHAKAIVNATGIFSDQVRKMDEAQASDIITTSQGIHLVLPRSFMSGNDAIMIPKTHDGRVLFIIPWHNHLLVGTTDSVRDQPQLEPLPAAYEIEYLLEYLNRYLAQSVEPKDILSTFAGLRPLIGGPGSGHTSRISRDYHLRTSKTGLITLAGGKWTTYRAMGEAAIDEAERVGNLEIRKSVTANLKLHDDGEELKEIKKQNPKACGLLYPDYPWSVADVIHAVRNQLAQKVEDVLSRRIRALPLNARAAEQMATKTVQTMAEEMNQDNAWIEEQTQSFGSLVKIHLPNL